METKQMELIGNNHEHFSIETPLKKNAFDKSNFE